MHRRYGYAAGVAVSITVLASGSGGNCSVVSSSGTRLLIDAGSSCKGICKRMALRGIAPESLDAVLIMHEHADHVTGLFVLAKKFKLPVYMTKATHRAWTKQYKDNNGERVRAEKVEHFHSGHRFQVGDIEIAPFHDSARRGRSCGIHVQGRKGKARLRHRPGLHASECEGATAGM